MEADNNFNRRQAIRRPCTAHVGVPTGHTVIQLNATMAAEHLNVLMTHQEAADLTLSLIDHLYQHYPACPPGIAFIGEARTRGEKGTLNIAREYLKQFEPEEHDL